MNKLKTRIIDGIEYKYISYDLDDTENEYPSDYYVKIVCDSNYEQAVKESENETLNKFIHSIVSENNIKELEVITYLDKYKELLIEVNFIGGDEVESLLFNDLVILYMVKNFVDEYKGILIVKEDSSYKYKEQYKLTNLEDIGIEYKGQELKHNQTIFITESELINRLKELVEDPILLNILKEFNVNGLKINILGNHKVSTAEIFLNKEKGGYVTEFDREYMEAKSEKENSIDYQKSDYINDEKEYELISYAHSVNNEINWRYKQKVRKGENITKTKISENIIKNDLQGMELDEYINKNVYINDSRLYSMTIGKYGLVNILNAKKD